MSYDAFDDGAGTVHDERGHGFFIVDNAVMDEYMARITTIGFAIYGYLVRRANAAGKCFPSYSAMACDLCISRRSAIHYLGVLQECGLVRTEHRKAPSGDATSNVYTVLRVRPNGDRSVPKTTRETQQGSAAGAPPSAAGAPRVVQQVHPKKTHSEQDTLNKQQVPGTRDPLADRPSQRTERSLAAAASQTPETGPAPPAEPPALMPDGTRRLSAAEVQALERVTEQATGKLIIDAATLALYRQLFAEGLTPGLLAQVVEETLQRKPGWRPGSMRYFERPLRERIALSRGEDAAKQQAKARDAEIRERTFREMAAREEADRRREAEFNANAEQHRAARERMQRLLSLPADHPEILALDSRDVIRLQAFRGQPIRVPASASH